MGILKTGQLTSDHLDHLFQEGLLTEKEVETLDKDKSMVSIRYIRQLVAVHHLMSDINHLFGNKICHN